MARKNKIFIAVIVFIILMCLGWWIIDGKGGVEAAESGAQHVQTPATSVSVITVQLHTLQTTKTLPGRISAYRQAQIRPQVDGIITERFFEEGSKVEKGQQLYQIDDARYKAALVSAEADLQSARSLIKSLQSRVKRSEELVNIQAVSEQEYEDAVAERDQAQAAIAVAQAAVDVATVNLGYTKVYAPISGNIGRSLITEGGLVTANQGDPLAIITLLDPVYVDMQQSGVEAVNLNMRMAKQKAIPVEIMIGENNQIDYQHKGELKFSEVTVDEGTGSITLRAVIPNPDGVLLPGLFVRSVLELGTSQEILVPQRATIRGSDGALSVWVVSPDNTVRSISLKTGPAHNDSWIVTDGLSEGDIVVVEGHQKLAVGSQVNPMPWNRAGAINSSQPDTLSNISENKVQE